MIRSICFSALMLVAFTAVAQGPAFGDHGFIRNMGQVHDQHGRVAPEVHYIWPGGKGLNVQLRDGVIAYDTYVRDRGREIHRMQRLDIRFLGTTGDAHFVEEDQLDLIMNFFMPHCRGGIIGVPHFGRVVQQGLYPGIDLVHAIASDGGYKYDLVVHEGADAATIMMEYTGFNSAIVRADSITFTFDDRTIIETIPASWTAAGAPLDMRYTVLEQEPGRIVVGFEGDVPTASGGMVIDPRPFLEWSSYFGHEGDDAATSVVTDTIGIMHIAGHTDALITLATTGAHQVEYAGGGSDAFLMRMASWGSRIWCTYFGGAGADVATGVSVDHQFRIYLTGYTDSDSLATDSVHQTTRAGAMDAFVAKFDSTGNLMWCSYLGGMLDDMAMSCVEDGNGGVFITGNSPDADLFGAAIPVKEHAGGSDAFIAHFNSVGMLEQGTFLGGEGDEVPFAIDRNFIGMVAITGGTTSAEGIAIEGAHQEELSGTSDAFIIVLNDSLTLPVWATYFGGEEDETARAIVLTDSTVTIGEYTNSPDLLMAGSSHQDSLAGGRDGFAARFSIEGDLEWSTYFGGEGDDFINDIDIDLVGALYLIGTTDSPGLASDTTYQANIAGGTDILFAKFNPSDTLEWSSYFGGAEDDHGEAFAVYGVTVVFLTGITFSENFPTAEAEYPGLQMEFGGGMDAFVTRFVQMESTPCVDVQCTSSGGGGGSGSGVGPGPGTITCGVPVNTIAICLGDSVNLSVLGGALGWGSYWMWYANSCGNPADFIEMGPEITIFPTENMTVRVRAENAFSFTACRSFVIKVDQPVTAVATGPEVVCQGTPVELLVSGGTCHYWSGPDDFEAFTAEAVAPTDSLSGTVEYIGWAISEHAGCVDQDTVVVQILDRPHVEWSITDPLCVEGTGSIAADSTSAAVHAFEWSASGSTEATLDSLPPGAYVVMVVDTLGCSRTDTLQISIPDPRVDTMLVVHATCGEANGMIQVIVDGDPDGFDFDWDIEDEQGAVLENLQAGSYPVTITDPFGCIYELLAMVTDSGSIAVTIIADATTITVGDAVSMQASITPSYDTVMVQWSPPEFIDDPTALFVVATLLDSTTIVVVVTSPFGCTATDTIMIHVAPMEPIEPVDPGCPELFIPTMFSPNSDGRNDGLRVYGGCISEMRFMVFDRWGKQLFASTILEEEWDGSFNGVPVAAGPLQFTFSAIRDDGSEEERNGVITLVR